MLRTNSFSGGSNGVTISTANSGGDSGDAFSSIGGSPSYITSNATGLRAPMVASMPASSRLTWDSLTLADRTLYVRTHVYCTGNPASTTTIIDIDVTSKAGVRINTAGRALLVSRTGSTLATSTSALPTNQWVRVELQVTFGTTSSNGSGELRIYHSADSTTVTESLPVSGVDFSTTVASSVNFFGFTGLSMDDVGASDVTWLGPAAVDATAAPSAVAAVAAVPVPRVDIVPSPDTVASATATPTPAVSTGQTAKPSAVASVTAVPAPDLTTGQTVDAAAVASVATAPTATVSVGDITIVPPDTVAATSVVVDPDLSIGSGIPTASAAATSTVYAPTINTGITLAPAPVASITRVPLPSITVPILPGDLITLPGQVEYDGALWGPGTSFRVNSIKGWTSLPSIDNGNVLRPRRHGAWPGRKLAQQRLVTIQLQANASADPSVVDDLLDELAAATAVPDDETEKDLVIRGYGDKRFARGAVIDYVSDMDDDYSAGMPSVSVLIACSDARKYGPTVTSVVVANGESSPATNVGNTSTHPVVFINGPCSSPILTNETTGLVLAFNVTLGANQTLVVDTNAGTVLLGSADYIHALAALSVPPDEWHLSKGTNVVSYSASSGGSNGVELQFRHAYLA